MWNKKTDWKADVYRLSLVDDSTHQSIRTYKFTKIRFAWAAVAAVIVALILLWCIIAFTPLRTLIPGYPDSQSRKVSVANAIKIDSLESAITRWNLYAENLSRVLSGEETFNYDSLMAKSSAPYLSEKSEEELQQQEDALRETVREEEQFGLGGDRRSIPIVGMHFFPPLKGVVSKGFDRALHCGVDISATEGSIVSAVFDGSVVSSGWDSDNGYVIVLQHKDNVLSIYRNAESLLVKTGDAVSAGTPIALVGSTSKEGLHFELWQNGIPLNPQDYISF